MAISFTDIDSLIQTFEKGTDHLIAMVKGIEFPWEPNIKDPRQLHNMYARNLISCYVSKFADLSDGILYAIRKTDFLTYSLCGRALIETTAMLRHYIFYEYKPLMEKGTLDATDYEKLIEIDDRHLRGSKFDWESFLFRRYSKLKAEAVTQLQDKKKKKSHRVPETIVATQINVVKCIDEWASQTPEVLIAYSLFCDLVHPNIGSNFLVASTSAGKLYFSKFQGDPVGRLIFEQSFPILLSVSHKPFGDYLMCLMGTIWQDDELSP